MQCLSTIMQCLSTFLLHHLINHLPLSVMNLFLLIINYLYHSLCYPSLIFFFFLLATSLIFIFSTSLPLYVIKLSSLSFQLRFFLKFSTCLNLYLFNLFSSLLSLHIYATNLLNYVFSTSFLLYVFNLFSSLCFQPLFFFMISNSLIFTFNNIF